MTKENLNIEEQMKELELEVVKGTINPRTKRKVTEFQFKVYKLCSQIPKGKVSTYLAIAKALNSSPRAVGQALRVNPYAPSPVPCHRVLSSTGFIGGFDGQWGEGVKIDQKLKLLEDEGLTIDKVNGDTRLTNISVYLKSSFA